VNKFATIVKAIQFRRITYYSVLLEKNDLPLFSQFIKEHAGEEFREDMDLIRSWMRKMGENYGASMDYFRPEGSAHAIPPSVEITRRGCQLRLYCLRMSHRVVILFSGGIKTTNKAMDCPNVRDHFIMANKLSIQLWKAFEEGLIGFDQNDDLIIPQDFKILL